MRADSHNPQESGVRGGRHGFLTEGRVRTRGIPDGILNTMDVELRLTAPCASSWADPQRPSGGFVWPRRADGSPFIWAWQVKGHLKSAVLSQTPAWSASARLTQLGPREAVAVISNAVMVMPLECRALRYASEAIRVVLPPELSVTWIKWPGMLVGGEALPEGSRVPMRLSWIQPNGWRMSVGDVIHEWLDAGRRRGLGRCAELGLGRFVWREL